MKTLRSVGEGRHVKQPVGNRFADQRVGVCETRDLGIGFPSWHALPFEEGEIVDMKVICPQDVKKTLKGHAREVPGKRWATRNESDELKRRGVGGAIEGVVKEETNQRCTTKHVNVASSLSKKLDAEKLYEIGTRDRNNTSYTTVLRGKKYEGRVKMIPESGIKKP